MRHLGLHHFAYPCTVAAGLRLAELLEVMLRDLQLEPED